MVESYWIVATTALSQSDRGKAVMHCCHQERDVSCPRAQRQRQIEQDQTRNPLIDFIAMMCDVTFSIQINEFNLESVWQENTKFFHIIVKFRQQEVKLWKWKKKLFTKTKWSYYFSCLAICHKIDLFFDKFATSLLQCCQTVVTNIKSWKYS